MAARVRPGLWLGEEVVTAVEGGGELAAEAAPLAGLAVSTEEGPSAATIAGCLRWGRGKGGREGGSGGKGRNSALGGEQVCE